MRVVSEAHVDPDSLMGRHKRRKTKDERMQSVLDGGCCSVYLAKLCSTSVDPKLTSENAALAVKAVLQQHIHCGPVLCVQADCTLCSASCCARRAAT